jgi:hypothetical protein
MTIKESIMLKEIWVIMGKPLTPGTDWFFLDRMFVTEDEAKWVADVMDSLSYDFRHCDKNGKNREIAEVARHEYIVANFDSDMVKAVFRDIRKRD